MHCPSKISSGIRHSQVARVVSYTLLSPMPPLFYVSDLIGAYHLNKNLQGRNNLIALCNHKRPLYV